MSRNVPFWADLPSYAQDALSSRDYGHQWFDPQPDVRRLTVLNLFVKLSGTNDLWKFVSKRDASASPPPKPGCIQFKATDVSLLVRELGNRRSDFTRPANDVKKWECRERRADGPLHFKHFTGWTDEIVEAHIDQAGLYNESEVDLGQAISHFVDWCRDGYQKVFEIRDLLLKQGWDPQPLLGKRTR